MDRRSFLKIGAVTAGSSVMQACGKASQKVIPFVTRPDDGVNPVDGYWYATTCSECGAGCGVIVRTVNGRAKKIEGNAAHPVNKGKLCARGQAAVQRVYHPERLSTPMLLKGPRGSGKYESISWDSAISLLGKELSGADGKVFFLDAGAGDATAGVANAILKNMKGAALASNTDPGLESHFSAGAALADGPAVPFPDMENADFTLLLGADLFEAGVSPVYYGRVFGASRRDRPSVRGRLVYIGSRLSATAAACDKWIPAAPGRLGVLALSIAHVVVEAVIEKELAGTIPRNSLGRWSEALMEYRPEKVAEEVEVEASVIRRLARPFVEEAPAVAIGGDDLAGYTNGSAGLDAVAFLNMVSYEIGREKLNIRKRHSPESDPDLSGRMMSWFGPAPADRTFDRFKALKDGASAGRFKVGLISHTNPVFDTPAGFGFKSALGKVGFVAAFTNFMDETSAQADLILPDNHWLENWSAQMPIFIPGVPVFNLRQPVIRPFKGSRSASDVLLASAKAGGLDVPAKDTREYMKKFISEFRVEMMDVSPTLSDDEAWRFLLRHGGWWPGDEEAGPADTPSEDKLWAMKDRLKVNEPEFANADFKYHLHLFQTSYMGRGQYANQGWIQEAPDPITTLTWQSWIEMNPATAAKIGVIEGDLVTVTSFHGSITAPVFPYIGLRPDVVAVPMGYGHTNYGKVATGRGANPALLLGVKQDAASGALAWRSQKVSVKKAGGSVKMLRDAHPEGEYKGEIFQL